MPDCCLNIMSTVATGLGLALAATGAFVVVMLAKEQFNASLNPPMADAGNVSNISYLDPDGPEVQFVLFTRDYKPFNLKLGDTKGFSKSGFNSNHSTKIVVHGFTSSIREEIFVLIKNSYLQTGYYNVIGVDWSVLCETEYLSALRGVRLAGETLAKFMNWLNDMGVPFSEIHIIGHSLGAHVAGVAGDKLGGGKVGRITGLDPAGPGYTDVPENYRLDPGDAKLVDVVHTFMKVLSLAEPLGHVDFYPNGGRFQPGCPDIYDVWRVAESFQCNHARAYYLFAEAIRTKHAFKSKRCKSVNAALQRKCYEDTNVYMGHADTYKNGLYYFKTRAQKPFSL